ncbi:hypothetical protein PS15p_209122 [Mucor circinelloides]
MSASREIPTTRHRLDTSSQSSDEFLQQFPAPPVPQHFSDSNVVGNNGDGRLNEKTYMDSNAPASNDHPIATSGFVQKPNDIHHRTINHSSDATPAPFTQRQPSIPNAYQLNTDFKFVDRQGKKVHWTKRNCFLRWVCCSMCFPPWVAYILWFIVIAVIICIIVIGALLGSFKMPTIDFAGLNSTLPSGTQQIEFSSTGVVIHAGLLLNIVNPNVLSMKLSNLTAKAYYPINGTMVQIGKGYLDYQFIPKKSDINFTYPFEIDYNPSDPNSKYLLSSISQKCGFTGDTPSDIDISYDVSLNAQVLFVHVSPTISSSASFACPFQKGQLPGLSSTGSSGEGGLGGILGGLGAQVNETSSITASASSKATTSSLSLATTAHVSTVKPTSSSIASTIRPITVQSTHISTSSTTSLSPTSAAYQAPPSSSATITMSIVTLSTSTAAIPTTSRAPLSSTSVAVPIHSTSVQPRVVSTSTTNQSIARTTLTIHSSLIAASSAKPIRSSAPHPTTTPEDDDEDDNDNGEDDEDDGDDGDDDDGNDEDDSDDDQDDDQEDDT